VGPGPDLFFFLPLNIGTMKFPDILILSYNGLNVGIY
jgi:hypothetical protein